MLFRSRTSNFCFNNIDNEVLNYLKTIDFYSKFEIETIGNYCYKRKKSRFFIENKLIINEVYKMIDSLNKYLNLNIKLTNNFLIRLVFMFLIIKHKQEFKESDFYPFNNNAGENYLNEFLLISKFIKKYFISIDSSDLSIITIMIINKIHLDFEKQIGNLKDITIVYNFLDEEFLTNACVELGLSKLINNINFIPLYKLDQYTNIHSINKIILFENIKLSACYKDTTCIKINFPITRLDKVKLSAFL